LKVTLGTLKDKGDDLVAFLEPRVGTKPSLAGGEIEIEDEEVKEGVRPRHVKTYIKRFLYMNGIRKKYRVFVSGKELTIQEIELGEAEKEKEKKAPEKKVEEVAAKEEKPEEVAEEPAKEEEEEPKPAKPRKAPAKKPKTKKKKEEEA
jgi:type IV secretory pathway VirB10-like protein